MKNYTFYLCLSLIFGMFTSPLLSLQMPTSVAAKTGEINNFDQKTVMQELAATIQHFAFISHNLITTAIKNRSDNASLSRANQKIVDTVEQTYIPMVNEMRSKIFSSDPVLQKNAFDEFGNYILGLCDKFNIRNALFMKLPHQLDSTTSLAAQLTLIKSAITLLENFFIKIKPTPPLRTRIANTLFYNFFSTKIAPKIVMGMGPIAGWIWAVNNSMKYEKLATLHPHEQIFKHYEKVDHDKTIQVAGQQRLASVPAFRSGLAQRLSSWLDWGVGLLRNFWIVQPPPQFTDCRDISRPRWRRCQRSSGPHQSPAALDRFAGPRSRYRRGQALAMSRCPVG